MARAWPPRVGSAVFALLCATIAWARATANRSRMAHQPVILNIQFQLQLELMRAIWVMLPSTLLWGASFPLALAAVALRGQDPGRLVGGVYAANTVGAIAGALVTGLVLVGTVGSQVAQQVLIGLAATSGVLVLVGFEDGQARVGRVPPRPSRAGVRAAILLGAGAPLPAGWWRTALRGTGRQHPLLLGERDTRRSPLRSGQRATYQTGKVQARASRGHEAAAHARPHHHAVPENPPGLVIGCGRRHAARVSIPSSRPGRSEIGRWCRRCVRIFRHTFDVVRKPRSGHKTTLGPTVTTNETSMPSHRSARPMGKGAATLYTRSYSGGRALIRRCDAVSCSLRSTDAAVKSEIAPSRGVPTGRCRQHVNGQATTWWLSAAWRPAYRRHAVQARLTRREGSRSAPLGRRHQFRGRAVLTTRQPPDWRMAADAAINTDRT